MYNDLNSDLINSYAWDTAMAYIEKCGTNQDYANKGDQSGVLKKTGEYNDEECKINDISSNVYEWTTETFINNSSPSVYRGGSYNTMFSYPNSRCSSPDFMLNNDIGFRPILYF